MFGLLYGFYEHFTKKTEHHVITLGLDSVGKTALMERIKATYSMVQPLPMEKIMPTVGLNIARVVIGSSKLILWDLGGQAGLRPIWEKYYDEAQAIIFVIDASNDSRFEEAKSALEMVLRHPEIKRNIPLLILVSKADAVPSNVVAAVESRINDRIILMMHDEGRPTQVYATSAVNGQGVTAAIDWLKEKLSQMNT
ncbi:hypothetical protein PROFUN_06410 [Planoprotostelium fungivorum]|uniref:Uncharacterized protein n=1 Tax=Planoprotostelium fungivorum TaxID=1890364 RepID=A0A2P6NNT2_9EUKA|nr:hypothetical protein PROFUN_06410 [Planoprotostelium fungivorum]